MTFPLQLGYLVFEVRDVDAWAEFARRHLGLMTEARKDGSVHLRMDGMQQRMVLRRGDADDIAAAGIIAPNVAALDNLVQRVRQAGIEVSEQSQEAAESRRVRRLLSFRDPAGNPVELATGPFQSLAPFASSAVPGGFVTGSEGLGHAVLMVDDIQPALDFWTGPMGFTISDTSSHETAAGQSHAYFMHCNARHHSIALVQRPARSSYPRRLLHFMIEAESLDSVGMAFDRALDAGLTINRSLGRHPSDRMFSFYAATPSGFDFEFGWGGAKVDDSWPAVHYDHISAWGHRNLGVIKFNHG